MNDDELAMAYADDALDPAESVAFEQRLEAEPALAAAVASHRALAARLRQGFAPVAEEPVPARFIAMLDPKVVELKPRRTFIPLVRYATAMAATLAIGFFIGTAWRQGPVTVAAGRLVASASLAHILDGSLSGEQDTERVLLSFRDRDAHACRLFVTTAVNGIACREDGRWQLRQTAAPEPIHGGEYRQAASANTALMAAAQAMMTGEPMNGAAERRARDSGWD